MQKYFQVVKPIFGYQAECIYLFEKQSRVRSCARNQRALIDGMMFYCHQFGLDLMTAM